MKQKIPNRIQARAKEIIAQISKGAPVARFHGKRLRNDRTVISIPIGRNWRLLLRSTREGLLFDQILSHEDYNRAKPQGKRW